MGPKRGGERDRKDSDPASKRSRGSGAAASAGVEVNHGASPSPSRGRQRVEPPTPKRRTYVDRGEDDFCPGNIVDIELTNFMTYDYINTKPAPRLNLIMGPNGTGKSSLVCAICIGLAGEPKLLGRAGHVGDYVQRGKESATIKITLRGDTRDELHNITRKVTADNKSEWLINDRAAKKEDVKKLTDRFSIQVGNLTQFLPQDRVCEFAKLTSVDLLNETEQAVGDRDLHQSHLKLIEMRDEVHRLGTTVRQHDKTLLQHKAQNAELENDVERMQQRDELLLKVEIMKKKEPWLRYEKAKVDYLEAKEYVKEAEALYKTTREEAAHAKAPLM